MFSGKNRWLWDVALGATIAVLFILAEQFFLGAGYFHKLAIALSKVG